jgi:nucleotide-binding universal stress UspA family protein
MKAEENSGKSRLEAILGNVPHTYHTVEDDNLKEGIQRFAEEQSTDLLVLVAHQHNFFERLFGTHLTKDLTYNTHIPLLILHDKE